MHRAKLRVDVAWAYRAACLVLIALYGLLPAGGQMAAFLLISFATMAAVVVGLHRTPPGRRLPWWLLLAALTCLNLDNLSWYWYVYFQGRPTADGTIADVFGTLGQVFTLSGAIAVVIRRGRNDIGGLIDTTIVAVAVGGLLWDVILLPQLEAAQQPTLAKWSMFVDVMVLTGVLGALIRLLSTARRLIPALSFLAAALTFSLVGNVVVALTLEPATGARPAWTDMMFMAAYAALGLFGLHRSAVHLTRPGPAPTDDLTPGRLVFLGAAMAAIPAIGGGRQIFGYDVDGRLLAVGGVTVTSLAMIRIGRLAAERNRAERALRHQATHDPLTGLANRREFINRLTAALAAGGSVVVLFCDLDDFKRINDRLGHAAGDKLLVEVARRLRRCVRDQDLVSRFGGDEFVVLRRGATVDDVAELCGRIDDVLLPPVILHGEAVTVGASIGSVTADSTVDIGELIHRADIAMYRAKQSRRRERAGVRVVAA